MCPSFCVPSAGCVFLAFTVLGKFQDESRPEEGFHCAGRDRLVGESVGESPMGSKLIRLQFSVAFFLRTSIFSSRMMSQVRT